MSYSQSSTGSNGMAYNMLNASQSLSSTPRATPPPPKGGSQASSFGIPNGLPRGSFGGYDGSNDYDKPQIYRVSFVPRLMFALVLTVTLFFLGCLFQCVRLRNGS